MTTTSKIKKLREYVMKPDISSVHERIICAIFNALYVANRSGVRIDHNPLSKDIMVLDIYQVQDEIRKHSDTLITQMEIIDALRDLENPKLIARPATRHEVSVVTGDRIDAILLDYSLVEAQEHEGEIDTCTQALELWQQHLLNMPRAQQENDKLTELYTCDPRPWKSKTFELQEQLECERAMNDSLRNVIVEMAETLHVADPDARINMTSGDLLDLITQQHDSTDCPF